MQNSKHTFFDSATMNNLNLWLNSDLDSQTRKEIEESIEHSPQKIVDAFYSQLSFGTGGLRGIMGWGTNRMNPLTIKRATQGLANYLNKKYDKKSASVFIGYDSRNHSQEYAEEAAKVLAGNGITAYLCSALRPTPYVSFGCRFKKCQAAIVITASHNPPEYNGYKVYGADGGQVIAPEDRQIIEEVNKITDLQAILSTSTVNHPLICDATQEVDNAYINEVKKLQHYPEENQKSGDSLKVVYSNLHGSGITLLPRVLESWGFTNLSLVKEQEAPDGNFPTVASPNPEEAAALELGIKQLEETGADLLLATDPDADRIGVVITHNHTPLSLTGNQIAVLCLYHICEALKLNARSAFIKTIATTELFRVIAEDHGAKSFDVLTGFKFIAGLIKEWEGLPTGYDYLFGGEESYGYLRGTYARDKDAISSAALICEVALHAKNQGFSLYDLLCLIYRKYGVYQSKLHSLNFPETREGKLKMEQGIKLLRRSPPESIDGKRVITIEDYLSSTKIDCVTGKTSPLTLPQSNALLFWLEDQTKVLVRPSGTEPKVKVYCEVINREEKEIALATEECVRRASRIIQEVETLL